MADLVIRRKNSNEDLLERTEYMVGNQDVYIETDPMIFDTLYLVDGVLHGPLSPGKYKVWEKKNPIKCLLSGNKNENLIVAIYISREYALSFEWGTTHQFDYMDRETGEIVKMGANGEAIFRVKDPVTFYKKMVGGSKHFDVSDMKKIIFAHFVSTIGTALAKVLKEREVPYHELQNNTKIISGYVLRDLEDILLDEFGLVLSVFSISSFKQSEEDKEKLKAFYDYHREKAFAKGLTREIEDEEDRQFERQRAKAKQLAREIEEEEDRQFERQKIRDEYSRKTAKEIIEYLEKLDDKNFEREVILRKLEQEDYSKYLEVVKSIKTQRPEPVKQEKKEHKEIKVKKEQSTPVVKSSKYCVKCGNPIKTTDLFCPSCGERTQGHIVSCKHCGKENDSENKFCSKCGKKL